MADEAPLFLVARWARSAPALALGGSTRLLALMLGAYFNKRTETANPSVATLARDVGQSVRLVQYGLRSLCPEDGTGPFLLEPGAGRHRTNVYRLNVPVLKGAAGCTPNPATGCIPMVQPSVGRGAGIDTVGVQPRAQEQTNGDRPTETDQTDGGPGGPLAAGRLTDAQVQELLDAWPEIYGEGCVPPGERRMRRALRRPEVLALSFEQVTARWRVYLRETDVKYASPERFLNQLGALDYADLMADGATVAEQPSPRAIERARGLQALVTGLVPAPAVTPAPSPAVQRAAAAWEERDRQSVTRQEVRRKLTPYADACVADLTARRTPSYDAWLESKRIPREFADEEGLTDRVHDVWSRVEQGA